MSTHLDTDDDILWLTPAEAADKLRTTERRVRRMAQDGRLPHRKDGRYLRFTDEDIAAYVASTLVPARGSGRSSGGKGRGRKR